MTMNLFWQLMTPNLSLIHRIYGLVNLSEIQKCTWHTFASSNNQNKLLIKKNSYGI